MKQAFRILAALSLLLSYCGMADAASPSGSLTVTVLPADVNSVNNILLGIETGCPQSGPPPLGSNTNCSPDNGGQYETPRLSSQIGRYPDFSGAFTSSGPCVPAGSQTICGARGGIDANAGYPWQGNFGTLDNWNQPAGASGVYVYGCGTTAGNNDYLSNWAKAAANDPGWVAAVDSALKADFLPYINNLYYIRVNWEWEGTWFCWSPWGYGQPGLVQPGQPNNVDNPSISAATWSAGTLNTINEIRKILPGVKVCVEGPQNAPEQAYIDPIISAVDCLTFDEYFNQNIGLTSAAAWTGAGGDGTIPFCQSNPITSCVSLPFIAAYAHATGKPIVVNEWCDQFNDGYITPRFINWMIANNVVAQSYWDSDNGVNPSLPAGCHLASNANTLAAYRAAFSGTAYAGTYWKHQPVPPAVSDTIGY